MQRMMKFIRHEQWTDKTDKTIEIKYNINTLST